MDSIRIVGGKPLRGSIRIGGAKNASLPLMAASIMTDQPLILENIPDLADITSMAILLEYLGVEVSQQQSLQGNAQFCLNLGSRTKTVAPYDLVRKMRASILVLGPLLARLGEATVSLPGGCAIGTRPVDLHIRALQELGAEISLEEGYICAKAPKGLVGATITFPKITVTGTENILMAACLAKGETRLINAAREPEVVDLANCLIKMGAKIEGVGTDTLIIEGVDSLQGAHHTVVPDRIETGTFMMAAAMTYGEVDILNSRLDLLPNVTSLLQQAGVEISEIPNGMRVSAERIMGTDLITEPFPGFPTDLQAQFMALMTISDGASLINETIFENRFMHVPELQRLGANISVYGSSAMVRGVTHLIGAPVMATDLRASGSLVMAGLAAQGETIINRVYHLDRGYEYMEDKLAACGADIERIKGKGEARVTEEWSAVA